MIDHFEIKVSAFTECVDFYTRVLAPLGIECKWQDEFAAGYGLASESNTRFLIEQSDAIQRVHIAFVAASEESVKAFYACGIQYGYEGHGAPGLRPEYSANYYAAYLYDPDGNNIEAVVYV
ncbi:MAG: VOC family protein [Pseudomonadota bacterium]